MKRLGVFLKDADKLKKLQKQWERARSVPVIFFGPGFSTADDVQHAVKEAVHAEALSVGLPEIRGLYGINLETGEFLEVCGGIDESIADCTDRVHQEHPTPDR
jgi:hypothetical protein